MTKMVYTEDKPKEPNRIIIDSEKLATAERIATLDPEWDVTDIVKTVVNIHFKHSERIEIERVALIPHECKSYQMTEFKVEWGEPGEDGLPGEHVSDKWYVCSVCSEKYTEQEVQQLYEQENPNDVQFVQAD